MPLSPAGGLYLGGRRRPRVMTGGLGLMQRVAGLWKATEYDAGNDRLTDLSGKARHLRFGSAVGSDGNDPHRVVWDGTRGQHVWTPDAGNNYLSAPDSAALSQTGDMTIDVLVAMDDWTPSAALPLVTKWGAATARSYQLVLLTSGALRFDRSVDGTASISYDSTVATGIADGTAKWIRVSFDLTDGGVPANSTARFYTSDDGSSWTQLGAAVTSLVTTAHTDNATVFTCAGSGSGAAAGRWWRVRMFGADLRGGSGTAVFDWNAAGAAEPFLTQTESSSNAATVTFNRATGAQRRLDVVDRTFLGFGGTRYLHRDDDAGFDFGSGQSFTVVAAVRLYGTNTEFGRFVAKRPNGTGWTLMANTTTRQVSMFVQDADGDSQNATAGSVSEGVATLIAGVVDRNAGTVTAFVDETPGTPLSLATIGSVENTGALRVGLNETNTLDVAGSMFAWGVWPEALTAAQLGLVRSNLLVAGA